MASRAHAAVALFVAMVLAGCAQPPAGPPHFRAHGSEPAAMTGYDYTGATAVKGDGNITIDVDPAADTGSVVATFLRDGKRWVATFRGFAEARPFQEGGIRNDFQEHGASGNGDGLLPQIHALSAGWGTGEVTVDGAPFVDPVTRGPAFALHYMVTDTAPRSLEGKVTKSDGTTPFDPATPADAKVFPGQLQVLLNVQSPGGPHPADNVTTLSGTVDGPNYEREAAFTVEPRAVNASVAIAVTTPTAPTTVGTLTFTVTDAAGQEVGRYVYDPTVGGAAGRGATTIPLGTPPTPGNYTMRVTGTGLQVNYSFQAIVDYADAVFVHVVYARAAVDA